MRLFPKTIEFAALLLLICTLLIGCNGCPPVIRDSDAGDYAFARQVIPILYGRKAKGYDEIKLVGDMSARVGREITVRALMEHHEFVDHWAEFFVDQMRVNREGEKEQSRCFDPTVHTAGNSSGLAGWMRLTSPDIIDPGFAGFGVYSMTDVIRSSILLDDLSPAYRAYLFPLVFHPPRGNQVSEENKRKEIFAALESVYLSRKNECLSCHNSAFSTTGPESDWNRAHPIRGYFEQAIYGNHIGRDPKELISMVRTDVNNGFIRPWGMISECGTFKNSVNPDNLLQQGEVAFLSGSHGQQGTVFDIERRLRAGIENIAANGLNRFRSTASQQTCQLCGSCTNTIEPPLTADEQNRENAAEQVITAHCTSCHVNGFGNLVMTNQDWKSNLIRVASQGNPAKARVKPGDAVGSYLVDRITSTGVDVMPPGGSLMPLEQNAVIDWINGLPSEAGCSTCGSQPVDCNGLPSEVNPEDALAFLTAATVVNEVWREVMGYSLIIDNYFPRNAGQRNLLWHLTEYSFVNQNWSLKDLLTRILTLNYFNRKAPEAGDGTTPYEMPLFFDPWVEGDPRVPPEALPGWTSGGPAPTPDPAYDPDANPDRHNNAMTEAIHRYSARSLFTSVSKSLDWPGPRRFPHQVSNQYPQRDLAASMGQFIKDAEPGFRGTDFQGLLKWESIHGTCEKPQNVATDWVDDIVAGISGFNSANPGNPATIQDIIETTKSWLIGDATIETTAPVGLTRSEEYDLEQLFGVSDLSVDASSVADLSGKLRRYCGALVETPQFMLAGIAPTDLGPQPRIRVCNGAPCSYFEICRALEPVIEAQGAPIQCLSNSVQNDWTVVIQPNDLRALMELLCRDNRCTLIEPIDRCRLDPRLCELPPCHPGVIGCGGPIPSIDLVRGLMGGKILTVQLAGEAVHRVSNVTLFRNQLEEPIVLERGMTLQEGDLIQLAPGSMFEMDFGQIKIPDGDFGMQPLRIQNQSTFGVTNSNTLQVLVTSENYLLDTSSDDFMMINPGSLIDQIQEAEWVKHGSATRLNPEDNVINDQQLQDRIRSGNIDS